MSEDIPPNCLPSCSLCCTPASSSSTELKRCANCKTRTYCNKKCQVLDWKLGGHKQWCQSAASRTHARTTKHQPWCAYLDRDPELDDACLVTTNTFRTNPKELITTGMNTCMFVVIKTKDELIGWHASEACFGMRRDGRNRLDALQKKLQSISMELFVSGFIVPGEDREEDSLDLRRTSRTMQCMPWKDPSESKMLILGFLQQFPWYDAIQKMKPVESYKDFVVMDTAHKEPFTFQDEALFDQGCVHDAGVGSTSPMDFMTTMMF